jgi:acyl transferase domain-containing protein/acyl carrier protein
MSQDAELADAVAVIGMSCRFAPDLDSLAKLWTFLAGGHTTVSEMPAKRWDPYASSSPQATAILRETTRKGSFLDDIEGFDAEFFGISPREADFLDPQQRVVLELAWEALTHAGVPPLSLRGSEAGVFVAANSNDYGRRLLEDIPRTGAYAVNGTTYYGIANRVSYALDLRGPSVAVDTACAGSLTALHFACQSLRLGESPLAIVGGVNIMATPALFVALDAAGATSPDGRSKAFDQAADGYGRGEGAGVVVLKRLADARRDGDIVLALIRGSGVFQDGRSDGMMAPNSEAQEHMLRQVYDRFAIEPGAVGYVEAHGTGTPVGDREEARALARVFGVGRAADDPCLVGSVKPNIGHVEAGSGIAGVIKTVLALHREQIPPSLHGEPSPEFDWRNSGLRLVGELQPWPAGDRPRLAGVSSYGVGGTIAHLVLQEAPQPTSPQREPAVAAGPSVPAVYPLSAMSDAGLRALAGVTADWLVDNPGVDLTSVGHTLSRRRSHLAYRAAVVADSATELTTRLRALAEGEQAPGVAKAWTASGNTAGVVWVFSGHGAQWSGMGQGLLRDEPAFAATMDALGPVFQAEMGWTPREAIVNAGDATTSQVQAMTFAMQVGLAEVWRRHGITPAAVIGHSVGEIAAAVAAGCLDLEEAARFACRRATALERLEGLGGMALVSLPFVECQHRLGERADVVAAIAASPDSTVISGDRAAVEELTAQWQQEGLQVLRVDTTVAFHSPQVDTVVPEVAAAAGQLTPRTPRVDLYTTALPDPRSAAARDAGYWADNLREPVRFADAVEAAIEDGHRIFLEISSHPVVTHSITETLEHHGVEDGTVVASVRRHTDEVRTLLANLGELHCHGAGVDWPREHPAGDLLGLPGVAWQHRPYWIFSSGTGDIGPGGGHDPDSHTLLGGQMTVSDSPTRRVWQTFLDLSCRPYRQSHEVFDVEITPAAVLINTFVTAATRGGAVPGLSDIVLRTPVAVTPPRVVQVVLAESAVRLSTRLAHEDGSSSDDEEHEWITHCTATIDTGRRLPAGQVDTTTIRARCEETLEWSRIDDMFRRMGVGGYAFPWDLDAFHRNGNEQLAVLTIEPGATHASSWAHVIDGALTISAVVVTPEDARRLWMSSQVDSVVFDGPPPARVIVHSRRSSRSPYDTVDVVIGDETGRIVCEVSGLRFAALQDQIGALAAPRDLVHELAWLPLPADGPVTGEGPQARVALVGDGPLLAGVSEQLERAGTPCAQIGSPEELQAAAMAGAAAVVVSPARAHPGESPEQAAERCAWTLVRTAQRVADIYAATDDGGAGLPKLWCVTHGVRQATDEAALAHAPLWGAARIIAGEHPELWGGVIDVADLESGTGRQLLPLLQRKPGDEDIISVSADGAAVARLRPIERPSDGGALQCQPSGTYLITGGLGALGLAVARWLADRGARRLLLASRRGLPPRAEWPTVRDSRIRSQIDGVLALEALGLTVRVLSLDITDADQVATALDPSTHGLPPVRGIVHAAGVVRDAMVDKVDLNGLRDVLGPKAQGVMVLHRLFPPGDLDFFVLFSSCGQFARLTGQTSYAAANSFLDTLAAHRQAGGHTDTVSYGWTAWQGTGMSETIANTMLEANARGLGAVSPAEALRAWSFGERFHAPYLAVLRVLATPPNAPRMPMFRELTPVDADASDADGATGLVIDWDAMADDEIRDLVVADVREQVAAELNLAADDVELRRPLVEFGVDSVMTVALRVRMQRRYGLELPPNILWNRPTVSALAGHLVDSLRPEVETTEA